jgi:hypothetical protein
MKKSPKVKKRKYTAATLRLAYEVADRKRNRRDPQLEAILATNGGYSFQYATRILHERFHEGEEAIVKEKHTRDEEIAKEGADNPEDLV